MMAMAPVMDISTKTNEQLTDIIAKVEADIDECMGWAEQSPTSAMFSVWTMWADRKAELLRDLLEEVARREAVTA